MVTCMVPSYANIFNGDFEEKMLKNLTGKTLVWLRYIDDIFFICTDGLSHLGAFIAYANDSHPKITFLSAISTTNIPFLDVMVTLQTGILQMDLYSKPTDKFKHLH